MVGNVWIKSTAVPPTALVAKQDHFDQNVILCVWWNLKGIIYHFDLVQYGTLNAAALYSEQLDDRVYATLAARRYSAALINRKHAMLLQMTMLRRHWSTAALIKAQIKALPLPPQQELHFFFLIQHMLALILRRHPLV